MITLQLSFPDFFFFYSLRRQIKIVCWQNSVLQFSLMSILHLDSLVWKFHVKTINMVLILVSLETYKCMNSKLYASKVLYANTIFTRLKVSFI